MSRSSSREAECSGGKPRSRSHSQRSIAFERQLASSSSGSSTASSQTNSHSNDDIRSFCDSISHMAGKLSKSLSMFGWQPTPTVSTQPHPVPTSARFAHLHGLESTYVEPAQIPVTAAGMTVFYDCERDVQELTFMGANQCLEKQSKRGARNPWRQYGALRKLHEIGGNAPEKMDKKHRKKSAPYVKIKKGSSPPNPPATAEIVLNGGKDVTILKRLHIPVGVPAVQLAQTIALEMQTLARDYVAGEEPQDSGEGSVNRSRSRKATHKFK